jgi:serine protease AprX
MEFKAFVIGCILILSTITQAGSLIRLQAKTFDPTASNETVISDEITRTWIVSFSTPINESMKSELRNKGFEILQFLPDSALVVRGDQPKAISYQEAWTPFRALWKWSTQLEIPSVLNQSVYRIVMLRTYSIDDAKKLSKFLNTFEKVFVLNAQENYFVVRASTADLFQISKQDEVAFVGDLPEFQVLNADLDYVEQKSQVTYQISGFETGTKVMNFESAWSSGFKGLDQIVAMGDTGVDRGDLQNIHADFLGAVLSGKNFAPFGRSWEDPMGHGTHVAGSVLSRGTASGGAFKGGAFEAKLVVHSLWSPMLNNLMVPTKLSDMFQAAINSGASVHTNSWGQAKNFGSYDSFARQVDEFSFNNPELLILFAAGNSGVDLNKDGRIDGDSIGSPGTAKNTLTVGASENYELTGGIQRTVSELRQAKENWSAEPIWSSKLSDNPRGLAVFSSRGPTDDGRIKPEIVAPGTNILSTFSHHPKAQELWGKYNDEYVWSGGTSMATPLAAGAAAVSRQILQKNFKVTAPSSSLLKAFMMSFATDLYPGQYGEAGASKGQELLTLRPNNDEGFGLVNMKSEVEANTDSTQVYDEKSGLATGESMEYPVNMKENGKLTVTLVWNDAPAGESAGKSLVNDLNLEISGNDLKYSSNDSVNNFEHFEKTAGAGPYKIKIIGRQVPQGKNGKQPFSLVITTR